MEARAESDELSLAPRHALLARRGFLSSPPVLAALPNRQCVMNDFLADDELARLHQLDLDAKAGVDADDSDEMTYAEWKAMNDEARATGN